MVAVIADGSEGQFETLADNSADMIIFVVPHLRTRTINRLARLAEPKLNEGGTLVVADSLRAAIGKVAAD